MYIPKPTIMTYVYTKAYFHYFCIYQSVLYLLMDITKLTSITYVYIKAYYNYLCIYQSLL